MMHTRIGARSAPNLVGLAPAEALARQRGAHSSDPSASSLGTPRASPLGGVRPWPDPRALPMTTDKDFKRLVRGRMQKTGESYTAARAQLRTQRPAARSPASVVSPTDYAKLAGKSDAIMKARTGCTWERWVKALDHAGAHAWTHGEIARHVVDRYKIPGWWAQSVTVGYERIKGLRDVGQRRGGAYEASKSRTFAVPLARLYRVVPRRAAAEAVAVRRERHGAERHAREVHARHLAGPQLGGHVVRGQGQRQEPGGDPAREAAGQGDGRSGSRRTGPNGSTRWASCWRRGRASVPERSRRAAPR